MSGEPSGGVRVGALILAAGLSRRMGRDKLSAPVGGVPLVRRVAQAVLASRADPILVVTGPDGEVVRSALAGMPLGFCVNPAPERGLSGSLAAGLEAADPSLDGIIVCLGDMPDVSAHTLDALVAALAAEPSLAACIPVQAGRRGNPVLLARRIWPDARALTGDAGARRILNGREDAREVPVDDPGIHLDLDTPDALAAYEAERR